ncbi:MAG: hypothetical protein ACR650_16630 [Methylocystis sp.]
MQDIKQHALEVLENLRLADLPGRPFDNAHSLFGDRDSKRLIFVGLNGSMADDSYTNSSAISHGFENPDFSNLESGLNGGWGKLTLPKRLCHVSLRLGFKPDETIFTNSILMCSKDASAISQRYREITNKDTADLVDSSMRFFKEFTLRFANAATIVVHGNSTSESSAANILYRYLHGSQKFFFDERPYHAAYWFSANLGDYTLPVLCLRHLSRYAPNDEALRRFREEVLQA